MVEIPKAAADVFQLYFMEDLCRYIAQQTNMYAEQVMGTRYTTWDELSEEELRAY